MPASPPDDVVHARLQGKRAALGVVLLISIALIASSSLEIVPAVFGVGIQPIPPSPPGSAARICAEGVRTLARALERAENGAGSASFQARLEPEWDRAASIQQACGQSGEGLDAWAALARLRSAEEQLAPRPAADLEADLAPLRRDVIAHLRADLR